MLSVAVLLGAGGTAAADLPQDLVTGSSIVVTPDFFGPGEDLTEQFIVSAHSGPGGEDPHGMVILRSPLFAEGEVKADVSCMIVSGNHAQVGGRFDKPVVFDGQIFRWFEFIIDDNGPAGQGSDMISPIIFRVDLHPPDFDPCSFVLPALLPIQQGNYTVKDATA